jgi:hypothetical protein
VAHLIYNEQIKLRATWLNNAAVGLALGGVFLPFVGFATTPPHVMTLKERLSFIGIVVVWVVAVLLHRLAIRTLRSLREE